MAKNVSKEQMNKLPYIIAVDFDGTLVEDAFPGIGRPIKATWELVRKAQAAGAKLILWTSRDGHNLEEAIRFCNENELFFDAINENLPECQALFNNDTRKVYANEYWDDKAVPRFSSVHSFLDLPPEEEPWQ